MPASIRSHKYTLSDPVTAEIWLNNVQEKYADGVKRMDGYRNLARQILGWIGVIVALEINLFSKLTESLKGVSAAMDFAATGAFGDSMFIQMICFTLAAALGYSTFGPKIPEEPALLLKRIQGILSPEARERVAVYHTRAYDIYSKESKLFSWKFNVVTILFVVSLWLALCAAVFVFLHNT